MTFRPYSRPLSVYLNLYSVTLQKPKMCGQYNLTGAWKCKELFELLKTAGSLAYSRLHMGENNTHVPADNQQEAENEWADVVGEKMKYNTARHTIFIGGYMFRVMETFSYRDYGVLDGTGHVFYDRVIRDTFVGPCNTLFRFESCPSALIQGDQADAVKQVDWENGVRILPVFMTYGLCNWLMETIRKLKSGGNDQIAIMIGKLKEELPFLFELRQ